jgi:V8-like Glu-specific endopeptidase
MKNLFRYLSASLLLIAGCGIPKASTLLPQTTNDIVVIEESPPNFLDKWFTPTTIKNDPYPSICSLHTESGWLTGSGILIRPDVVLTAGHCIVDDDIFSIVIGEEEIMVKNIVLHPSYNETSGRIHNDVGLIFLETNSDHEPANIGCVEWMERYQDITTVGYSFGYKKYSKLNVFRYFGTVVEEPNYIKFIPRSATVWPGDSGGGVFAKFEDKDYVVGIISNYLVIETFNGRIVISECSATIIVKYLDWIEMEVLNNNDEKT